MDTSQFKPQTLQQVRDAIEEVSVARGKKGLTAADKILLQTTMLTLRSLERSIIDTLRDELVASLTADTLKLQELTEKINKSSKKLDKLAGVLETTSKVVDGFIKIVVTAVGIGLL